MPALNFFDVYYEDVLKGIHDFSSDTFKCAFSNTLPDAANDAGLVDITEIVAGNGYVAGGVTLDGVTVSRTGDTAKITITDEVFTASGGSVGPFQYFVIYNDTSAGDRLIGWYTRAEGAATLSDGESITLDFDGAAGVLTHGAAA